MKALLFGSIGVLADTSAVQLGAYNQSFEKHGLDWRWSTNEYSLMLSQSGGQNRLQWYAENVIQTPLDPEFLMSIHKVKTQLFNARLEVDGITLRPGILRLMKEAADSLIPCAWVTSTELTNLETIAHASGDKTLLQRFMHISFRGNVEHTKPHPDPYNQALHTLQVDPGQAVAVEDTKVCVRSAIAAGVTCIATPNSFTVGQDFSEATSCVSHLGDAGDPATQLTGDCIVDNGVVTLKSLTRLIVRKRRYAVTPLEAMRNS